MKSDTSLPNQSRFAAGRAAEEVIPMAQHAIDDYPLAAVCTAFCSGIAIGFLVGELIATSRHTPRHRAIHQKIYDAIAGVLPEALEPYLHRS